MNKTRVACDSKAVKNFCADYLTDAETDADITVTVSESEIEQEMSLYSSPHSRAYCENICLYRAIAERLPELERFVFHGAAVENPVENVQNLLTLHLAVMIV